MSNAGIAFLASLAAGLSTGLGSIIGFFTKRTNTKFLSVALGFSAGVMIFVSMVELYPQSVYDMSTHFGEKMAGWTTLAAFLGGMLLVAFIDRMLPSDQNPHEVKTPEHFHPTQAPKSSHHHLMKTGVFTALAIAIHNFPEGLASFASTLENPQVGLVIAAAIAVHNIPEGMAVSLPVYYATGSRKKAFWMSFLSGMVEPLGAVVGYLIFGAWLSSWVLGAVMAAVAGIMVYISLDELLPAAREYGEHHLSIYGLIGGMVLMGSSLLLLK